MNEDVACSGDSLTKASERQVWQKLLLGRGRTYEVAWDTPAALASFSCWLSREAAAILSA